MKPIAFFIPTLHGGGAEKVVINLLKGMTTKNLALDLDLVIANAEGPYLNQIPKGVRIIELNSGRVIKALFPLSRYLQQYQPQALISHMSHANVIAVIAKKLARTKTKLILVEHNTLSADQSPLRRGKLIPPLMKLLYPQVEAIVGVSQAVARDLEQELGLRKETVKTIYNPVVDDELLAKANSPLAHPWFGSDSIPVFLAVGRLTPQKDFMSLIRAFAIVRKKIVARLLILGEGESRPELEALVNQLNLVDDVALPGFVENPYAYMSRATAFILSSQWEGLGNVLIEAMACGCPVISTDCPSGPREILESGKYGFLVPVGDVEKLSLAMLNLLQTPVKQSLLLERAKYFSVERAVQQYLELCLEITHKS
jgi:glycosyltransferase involved in cell wall biosynthesis